MRRTDGCLGRSFYRRHIYGCGLMVFRAGNNPLSTKFEKRAKRADGHDRSANRDKSEKPDQKEFHISVLSGADNNPVMEERSTSYPNDTSRQWRLAVTLGTKTRDLRHTNADAGCRFGKYLATGSD